MGQKEAIVTDKSPPPLPYFSQAIKCQGMIYCSGSVGMDPKTNKLVEGSVADRTVSISVLNKLIILFSDHLILPSQAQCLANLSAILEAGGSSIDNCVKVNIFLT